MRILNYEVKFNVKKRHSFLDLFRCIPEGEIIEYEMPPAPPKWEHKINPEKRLHAMHNDILVYAFRDVVVEMTMFPEKAGAIFLSIIAFTETFKNDMILKGADEESIIEYDKAVDSHIESALNSIKRTNPEMFEDILSYLEDDNNDNRN